MPKLFDLNRIFIQDYESAYFIDFLWNKFDLRNKIRSTNFETSFSPSTLIGFSKTVIKIPPEKLITFILKKNQNSLEEIKVDADFCKKERYLSLPNNQKLVLRFIGNLLYFQDVSPLNAIILPIKTGKLIAVQKDMVFALGANKKHKFRIVNASPIPFLREYENKNVIQLNTHSGKNDFKNLVRKKEINSIFEMNQFYFDNLQPQTNFEAVAMLEIQFIEGPLFGIKAQFNKSGKTRPSFRIGRKKDCDVILDDLETNDLGVEFFLQAKEGWFAKTNGEFCTAFVFLKNWKQIKKNQSSFFHFANFDFEFEVGRKIWGIEKKIGENISQFFRNHPKLKACNEELLLYKFKE